MARADCFRNPK